MIVIMIFQPAPECNDYKPDNIHRVISPKPTPVSNFAHFSFIQRDLLSIVCEISGTNGLLASVNESPSLFTPSTGPSRMVAEPSAIAATAKPKSALLRSSQLLRRSVGTSRTYLHIIWKKPAPCLYLKQMLNEGVLSPNGSKLHRSNCRE